MDYLKYLFSEEVAETGWFQVALSVLTATTASFLTYVYTRKVSKRAEVNRLIDSIYRSMRTFIEFYKTNSHYNEKKPAMSRADVEIKLNDAKVELNASTRLLASLLSDRVTEKHTDYYKYTRSMLVDIYDEKKSKKDIITALDRSGERLERLLTTLHYEQNNFWLKVKINRMLFILREGRRAYADYSGERYLPYKDSKK